MSETIKTEAYKQYVLDFYTTSERNKAIEELKSQTIKTMILAPITIGTTSEGLDILKRSNIAFKVAAA